MTEENEKERRRFQRLERRDQIKIKVFSFPERGEYRQATIIDISGGGMQIETREFYAEKTVLKIEMNFTGWQKYTRSFMKYFGDAASRPLVVLGEVIRCQTLVAGAKYVLAINFSGIDESQRQALMRFIRAQILAKA